MGLDQIHQGIVRFEAYEIGDSLALAVLVDLRLAESSVRPEPKPFQPIPVPAHNGGQHLESTLGRMYVPFPELYAKAVPLRGETEQRMIAALPEVTVVSYTFLSSVCGIFGGIHVQD
jgi:hypothetical protein